MITDDICQECDDRILIEHELEKTSQTLSYHERKVLKSYFGIGQQDMTLQEMEAIFDIPTFRLRVIMQKAIQRLWEHTEISIRFGTVSELEVCLNKIKDESWGIYQIQLHSLKKSEWDSIFEMIPWLEEIEKIDPTEMFTDKCGMRTRPLKYVKYKSASVQLIGRISKIFKPFDWANWQEGINILKEQFFSEIDLQTTCKLLTILLYYKESTERLSPFGIHCRAQDLEDGRVLKLLKQLKINVEQEQKIKHEEILDKINNDKELDDDSIENLLKQLMLNLGLDYIASKKHILDGIKARIKERKESNKNAEHLSLHHD